MLKRMMMLAICTFLALNAAFALDDNSSPIKVGYAIITPDAAGLVAFETFGRMQAHSNAMQAGVLPAEMTTSALLFVNSSGRLSRNLGVAIANPGATPAVVTLTLYRDTGELVSTKELTVTAGAQTSRFVTELFSGVPSVPLDFNGSLSIDATVPVAIIGLRFRGENFSTIPITNLLPTANPVPVVSTGIGGANAVILPHFATGGGWASELILSNTSTAPMTVRVDLFGQDGQALEVELNGKTQSSFQDITIPAHGVVILSRRDGRGDSDF